MANVALLIYPERLQTFAGFWDNNQATARQLAAIGHIYDRPPLEVFEEGTRCISCGAFVRRELSVRALEGSGNGGGSYQNDFERFDFHHPSCIRLQVRIPLEPQATLPGLHGGRIKDLKRRFERRGPCRSEPAATEPVSQKSSLFSLPTEIRLHIYALVLPCLEEVTEVVQLNHDSAGVITNLGYRKTGPRDMTKPNILRTCRAVHDEAMDIIYCRKVFKFASTKIMYLFLRCIGQAGREMIEAVDVHCGGREDALAFALLATCEKLQKIIIRLPRPTLLFSRAPIWIIDGVFCLLSLRGLNEVIFETGPTRLMYLTDRKVDSQAIRKQLMLPRGTPINLTMVEMYIKDFQTLCHVFL